jgi:hypothetical protein
MSILELEKLLGNEHENEQLKELEMMIRNQQKESVSMSICPNNSSNTLNEGDEFTTKPLTVSLANSLKTNKQQNTKIERNQKIKGIEKLKESTLDLFGIQPEKPTCTRCLRSSHFISQCSARRDIHGQICPPNLHVKAMKSKISKEEIIQKRMKKKQDEFMKKTIECERYKDGKCILGINCNYSHDGVGFDPRSKQLCQYFRKGACTRGSDCIYSHDKKQFPCAFFHFKQSKGGCRLGESCGFSHDPLTSEQLAEYNREQDLFNQKSIEIDDENK